MISTVDIDRLIIGRIDPHIYAFSTNTVPNYLKVGDTYRPVNVRLDEWRTIFPSLEHDDNWEWTAKTQNGKYFRDFAVHYYLEQIKHFHRLQPSDIPNLPYYSKEFFQNASPKDIDEAILDIERCAAIIESTRYQFYSEERLPIESHFERTEDYPLRPNQEEAVEAFKQARKSGRKNLLMYAVMRFGKPLYIFDAMDEIPPDHMDALVDAIYKHIYIQNNQSPYFLFMPKDCCSRAV